MTQAQKIASNPEHSVYVGASAGSGKTKVLTDRVLRILLDGTPPAKIMCLTFTNAAAAEMANRINKNLMNWVVSSDEVLQKNIYELTGKQPDNQTILLARKLFVEVLDTPDGLKIQTIHAFCQNLMRRFPLEAGIAPHFKVIDEQTSLELLKESRMRLLSNKNVHDEVVTKAINNIAWRVSEGGFSDILHEITNQREKIEYLLSRYTNDEIIARTYDVLGVKLADNEQSIIYDNYKDYNLAKIKSYGKILLSGLKTDINAGEKILEFVRVLEEYTSLEEAFASYQSAFLTQKEEPRKELITKKIKEANPDCYAWLLKEQSDILKLVDKVKSIRIAQLTRDLFHVAESILALYKKSKSSKAFLDYNDLIIASNNLLSKDSIAPWILYKLDGGIDHLLVDEAQDTSPQQWKVIESLCSEFFAGQGASEKNRTIFIVGDEKQSIFSFQGADPKVFNQMQEVFSKRAMEAEKGWQTIALDKSFRSTSAILQCVDAIFSKEEIRKSVSFLPEYIPHIAHRDKQAGLVELWDLIEGDEKEHLEAWTLPVARIQVTNTKRKLAQKIAQTIKNWIDSGRKIEATGKIVTAGDIMILVRRRDALVEYLVSELKANGVAVAGVDRMVLTEHIAIMDLVALGNFLLLPQDDLTLATVLKTPLIGMSEDELFELAYKRGKKSLWEALREKQADIKNLPLPVGEKPSKLPLPVGEGWGEGESFQQKQILASTEPLTKHLRVLTLHQGESSFIDAFNYLSDLLNKTDFTSPFAIYSYVLEAKGGRKKLAERLGEEVNDPIDEFLSLALAYEESHPPALQGFLNWLSVGKTEIKRDLEQGNDEVRIMTVHGSKGLQAPIVFMPDTTSLPSNKSDNIFWTEKDGEPVMLWSGLSENLNEYCKSLKENKKNQANDEYLRLLYVALTRAEDELYVAGYQENKKIADDCWYNIVKNGLENIAQKIDGKLVLKCESSIPWEGQSLKNRLPLGEGWGEVNGNVFQEPPYKQTEKSRHAEFISASLLASKGILKQVQDDAISISYLPVGEFLPKLPLPLGEGWGEGDVDVTSPLPNPPPQAREGSRKSDNLPDFINAKIPLEPTPSIPLTPSLMRDDVPASQSPLSNKSVLRGKLIHKLLQYLPEIEASKWEDKVDEFLNKYDNELNLDEKKEILDAAFSVLNHKDIAHIFGGGSKAEVPIVGVVGNFVISGQIDRLLVTENEVLIIDYKTNRNPPESQHDVHINYIKQMAAYKMALQQIYPDKKIKCALIWTSVPKIMWLDDEVIKKVAL